MAATIKLLSHFLAVLGVTLTIATARAEFVLTMASGVYQHTDGKTKVVLASRNGVRGIFVMVASEPINPQEFNLDTTPQEGVRDVFIRFDEDGQPPTYSEVLVDGKSYKTTGNLSLTIGKSTIIGIDNNNPYLSIVTEEGSAKPSILAFSGLNEVVRATGSAATVLAANQLDSNISEMIRPFSVAEHELLLNGKPVSTPTIGTFVKPENECLGTNVLVLTSEQFNQVQATKGEDARVKLLDSAIKNNRKISPTKGHLVLRSDAKSVVLLDVSEKNVREMHPIKGAVGKRKLCVLSDLSVD